MEQNRQGNRRKMGRGHCRGALAVSAALLLALCSGGGPAYAREPMTAARESASVSTNALALDREQLFFDMTFGSRKVQEKPISVTNESGEDLVVYVRAETGHFLAGGEDFAASGIDGILEAALSEGETAELVISPREGVTPEESPCEDSFLLTTDTGLRRTILATAEAAYDEAVPELLVNGEPFSEKVYAGDVTLTARDGFLLAAHPEGPFAEEIVLPESKESTILCFQKEDGTVTRPQTVTISRNPGDEDAEKADLSENRWTEPLAMESWTTADVPKEPSAEALFGTVQYEYYDSGKRVLPERPNTPGFYFVRAMVPSENSTDPGLVSSYVAFQIKGVHAFGAPSFVWNEDHTSCIAVFSCLYEEGHREIIPAEVSVTKKDAACEEAGAVISTAQVLFHGKTYRDSYAVELPALGHRYTKALFSWSDDGSACEADFVCENDSSHVVSAGCRVTQTIGRKPTCTKEGELVRTASAVRPDGTPCSECRIEVLPAAHALVPEDGYYRCTVCGEKFADEEGTQEIH